MLTKKTMERFGRFITVSSWFATVPFQWNKKLFKFEKTLTRRMAHLWLTRVIIIWLYWLFLIARLAQSWLIYGAKVSDLTIHCLWCVIYGLNSLLHLNTVRRKEEILVFLNQFFFLNRHAMRDATGGKVDRSVSRFLTYFGVIASLHTTMSLFIFWDHPEKRHYLASVVLQYWNHWIVACVFLVYEFLQHTFNWGIILFNIFIMLSYIKVMGAWLTDLKFNLIATDSLDEQNQYSFEFHKYLLLSHRFRACAHPFLLIGHRIVVLPLTIAGFYITLNLFHLFFTRRKVYMTYVVITMTTMIFQYNYYRASMCVYDNAKAIQSFIMRRDLNKSRGLMFTKCFRGLPKYVSSFQVLKLWRPPVFLKKIVFATIKIHFYLHSNVEAFKRQKRNG